MTRRALATIAVPLAVCAWLGACSAPETTETDASPRHVGLVDGGGPLGLASDGLAVRELRVNDDGDAIATMFEHYGHPVLDAEAAQRLARNGIRFVRVDRGELDAALAALGPAYSDVEGWHGQVLDWQTLREVPVVAAGRAVAVDGRVQGLRGGRVELRLRGWTMRMEDGPCFQLELAPEYATGARSRLSAVLDRGSDRTTRFTGAALEVQLEPGAVYAMTYLDPTRRLAPGDGSPGADDGPPAAPARPARGPDVRAIGPGAEAPVTVGEMLFREKPLPVPDTGEGQAPLQLLGPDGAPVEAAPDATIPARRRVYLLVPRIPAALLPKALS